MKTQTTVEPVTKKRGTDFWKITPFLWFDNDWQVLLGQGNSLFKNLSHEIKLRLLMSKTFASGVISLHYATI